MQAMQSHFAQSQNACDLKGMVRDWGTYEMHESDSFSPWCFSPSRLGGKVALYWDE
jgi:hypothetical protein